MILRGQGQPNRRQALTGLGRGLLGLGALGVSGAALGGCASDQPSDLAGAKKAGKSPITVGSKGFAESWITGELYAQGLSNLGYTVDLKTNVGSSDIIKTALLSGQIDLYPEYTGVMVVTFMGEDRLMDSAQETFDLAQTWADDNNVTMLRATPFENKNAVAVRQEFADKHKLQSMSDLAKIGDFTYSTYPDNVTGAQGYEGIVETYGLGNMKLKTLSIGLNYQAIERGEIDAADVFTTDPQLLRSDLVVLDDDKKLFGFQNVVPLIRDDAFAGLDDDATEFLNELQSLLTLEAIQAMNEASAINRLDPANVAEMFLDENGLI